MMNLEKVILTSTFLFLAIVFLVGQNETSLYTDGIILPKTDTLFVTPHSEGHLIYDDSEKIFRYYDGEKWQSIGLEKQQEIVINSQLFIDDGNVTEPPLPHTNYIRLSSHSYVINNGVASLYAPIHIPNGAKLKAVSLICYDNDQSRRINLSVTKDATTEFTNTITSAPSPSSFSIDGITTYQAVTISFDDEFKKPVDNYIARIVATTNQNEFRTSWSGQDLRLSKLVIRYDLP